VHYIGLGHDFDEVLDLQRELNRIRTAGQMSQLGNRKHSLRKSKTTVGVGEHAGRMARRSFDSSPIQTLKKPTNSSSGGLTLGLGGSFGTEYDEDGVPLSPSLSPSGTGIMSVDWDSPTPGGSTANNSSASLLVLDEESPAFLLRNKESPLKANRPRRNNVSFTSKAGKVVPGAAMGLGFQKVGGPQRRHSASGLEVGPSASSELAFADRMESIGLHIVPIDPDGNCLFRALSHQLYCTEDRHAELRRKCVEHMQEHRERFEIFCTSDFDGHCRRMAMGGTWASELEIRALEEIGDRLFLIYNSDSKDAKPMPMQTNFDESLLLGLKVNSVKLSYHANHYNSVFDQKKEFPLGERSSSTLLKERIKLFNGD